MRLQIGNYTITIEKRALEDKGLPVEVQDALQILAKYGYTPPPSPKRQESAKRARAVLQQRTKKKIQDAIELLKAQKEEITPYKVAKVAQISYNTAKKYLQGIQ